MGSNSSSKDTANATSVVVYGMSTEGYHIATQMTLKGANVSIIDETTQSAIPLNLEIARTYPNVMALKEDAPLLSLEPVDMAVSRVNYLFFAPRIRHVRQEMHTDVNFKFKNMVTTLKKGMSIVSCVPTSMGGNVEMISILQHLTGFEIGSDIHYYYFPIEHKMSYPKVIGSSSSSSTFTTTDDLVLSDLLAFGSGDQKKFISLSSSEHLYAISLLNRFASMAGTIEVCRFVTNNETKKHLSTIENLGDLFLDDMTNGLYDLKLIGTSFEGHSNMMYLVNGNLRGIDLYIRRLATEIRNILKSNDMKASRAKVVVCWTIDRHLMREDKVRLFNDLVVRLRDYMGSVETFEDPNTEFFHNDQTTITVTCSKTDHANVKKQMQTANLAIVKATPLFDIMYNSSAQEISGSSISPGMHRHTM